MAILLDKNKIIAEYFGCKSNIFVDTTSEATLPHNKNFNIRLFHKIPSTNVYLKELLSSRNIVPGQIILAEEQTCGIGRNNRSWVSPAFKNIYMSVYWNFSNVKPDFSALGLVVGISLVDSIKKFILVKIKQNLSRVISREGKANSGDIGIDIDRKNKNPLFDVIDLTNIGLEKLNELKLKWPNDLYYQKHKLGGILVDTVKNEEGNIQAIIGCGLNVNFPDIIDGNRIIGSVANIYNNTLDCISKAHANKNLINLIQNKLINQEINRNELLSCIISDLYSSLTIFAENGFSLFRDLWQDLDYLYKKDIEVTLSNSDTIFGKMQGIDEFGGLIINSKQGIKRLYSVLKCRVVT